MKIFLSLLIVSLVLKTAFPQAGSIDPTFATDGKMMLDIAPATADCFIQDVLVQPDGKILFSGNYYEYYGYFGLIVARLTADGNVDSSFGTNGIYQYTFTQTGQYSQLHLQGDNKIILNSEIWAGHSALLTIRLNPDGTPDSTFGVDGVLQFGIQGLNKNNIFMASYLQPDGKIISGGLFYDSGSAYDAELYRLNTDGTPDTSFGEGGRFVYDADYFSRWLTGIAGDIYGNIYISGYHFNWEASVEESYILKIKHDGTPDIAFGDAGVLTITGLEGPAEIQNIMIQADQKMVVGGFYTSPLSGKFVARLNTDGTLDHTFHGDGTAVLNFHSPKTFYSETILQPDGAILFAGGVKTEEGYVRAISKLKTSGNYAEDFADSGRAVYDSTLGVNPWNTCIALQPDGKIIAGGVWRDTDGREICMIMRFNNTVGEVATGIPQTISSSNKFIIYPDPASDAFTLQIDNPDIFSGNAVCTMQMVNLNGETVQRETIYFGTDQTSPLISIANNIPNGEYIVKLMNGQTAMAAKLIISR